jgi:hypothetical protein
MIVEETHFQLAKMPKSARHEASSPGVKDFTTRQESQFQAAKMMKGCSPKVMFSSARFS